MQTPNRITTDLTVTSCALTEASSSGSFPTGNPPTIPDHVLQIKASGFINEVFDPKYPKCTTRLPISVHFCTFVVKGANPTVGDKVRFIVEF